MKKLLGLFLLCFSLAAHAQYDVVKVGNWDVSKANAYAALLSHEKSSLTSDQEKVQADLNVFCDDEKNLSVFFMWSRTMFPRDYQLEEVSTTVQWDSKAPESIVFLADPLTLFFPGDMTANVIDNLKKHNQLILRIRDSKNKWNLVGTFNLNGAAEAITVPVNACKK